MRPFLPALLLLALAPAVRAADPPPPPCPAPEARQFDFWIGEWDVSDFGQPAGRNTIRPILDGCVLQENWRGVSGSAGTSLNFWDPERQRWRQLWVWREGTTLELEGAFRDGAMVLEGASKGRKGEPQRNRISWSQNPDGTVRQHWEVSKDDGKTWKTEFDGEYVRVKGKK